MRARVSMMLLLFRVGVSHCEDLFMLGVKLALSPTGGAGSPLSPIPTLHGGLPRPWGFPLQMPLFCLF